MFKEGLDVVLRDVFQWGNSVRSSAISRLSCEEQRIREMITLTHFELTWKQRYRRSTEKTTKFIFALEPKRQKKSKDGKVL